VADSKVWVRVAARYHVFITASYCNLLQPVFSPRADARLHYMASCARVRVSSRPGSTPKRRGVTEAEIYRSVHVLRVCYFHGCTQVSFSPKPQFQRSPRSRDPAPQQSQAEKVARV